MASPSTRLVQSRRRLTTPVTPTEDISGILQPTPPPKRPNSSSSSRPDSGASSRHGSVSSRNSLTEIPRVSRQNSLLAPLSNDINMLPEAVKNPTTIGRHHTIVPPINRPDSAVRPISSRCDSMLAETPLPLNLGDSDEYNNDDHAITSISEENDPSGTPRLHNPLVDPRYIETPHTDPTNNNNNNIEALPELPDEPEEGEPRLNIAVKLLNGSRMARFFRPNDQIQTVLNFAAMHTDTALTGYTLRSSEGKYNDMTSTLDDCKIRDRTLLQLAQLDV